jgi:predicted RNase H-like nuclease (RuvC/YqgF family)
LITLQLDTYDHILDLTKCTNILNINIPNYRWSFENISNFKKIRSIIVKDSSINSSGNNSSIYVNLNIPVKIIETKIKNIEDKMLKQEILKNQIEKLEEKNKELLLSQIEKSNREEKSNDKILQLECKLSEQDEKINKMQDTISQLVEKLEQLTQNRSYFT